MPHRRVNEGFDHLSTERLLDERRKALEEAFFRKENERLRVRLHERREHDAAREALARHCGVSDAAPLDHLVDLGIRAETVDALVLVPLAAVAWADGSIDRREREAVLRAAHECGIAEGTPSHALLEAWTHEPPDLDLLDAWRDYVRALGRTLSPEQHRHLAREILGRARAVAEAAGGFLGIASVSKREEALLTDLAAAFAADA